MNFNSTNIVEQNFSETKKGFNKEEVDLFLNKIKDDFEEFEEKIFNLENEMQLLADKIGEYEKIETDLRDTLISLKLSDREILKKAKEEADQIIEEAEQKSITIIDNAEEEFKSTRDTLLFLKEQKDILLIRLKTMIDNQDGMLEDFLKDNFSEDLQKSMAEAAAFKSKAEINIDSILEKLL
jgi:DivIVA domain-containing protein